MTRHSMAYVFLGTAAAIAVGLGLAASPPAATTLGKATAKADDKAAGNSNSNADDKDNKDNKNDTAGDQQGNKPWHKGSNEKFPQPKLIENSYPLATEGDRQKSIKICQQLTVDLLALFDLYKEAHWNLNGPLYLVLHEYYQKYADFYRTQADIFAERVLHLGDSVDGRFTTIAKTTRIPNFPPGYVTDNESLQLLIERVTVFQKEVYKDMAETEKSDPTTCNKLQELAYFVDKNLWQLRIHLARPGSLGQNLPWASQQGLGGNNQGQNPGGQNPGGQNPGGRDSGKNPTRR